LFAFEFVEGNTVTRLYFMRLRRLTQDALTAGAVTPQIAKARARIGAQLLAALKRTKPIKAKAPARNLLIGKCRF
ncbi:MAG: hypothetical protein ACREV3_04040, partial [Gammaproteobacteria bacterium]